jgi:transposase
MSTVRLRRIEREYRNERYRTVSGIFPLQHEGKICTDAPLTFPLCTARKWLSPTCHQRAVIQFRAKEGKLGRSHLRATSWCVWRCLHGVSTVRRWLKHFKDGNTNIADQPRCGQPRTVATERNKKKVDELIRQDRRITVRETAAQLGVGHHAVQEMMKILGYRKVCSRWVPRLLTGTKEHRTARNCSPVHPSVRIWPPQITTCSGPWKLTWEVTATRLTRQSRKPCEAGCEELERTSTAEACLRFCTAGRMHR